LTPINIVVTARSLTVAAPRVGLNRFEAVRSLMVAAPREAARG